MLELEGKTVFHKLWYFLRMYILTLKRFDLFLQGTLLIVILLDTNVFLLLRRDTGTGYLPSQFEDWVYLGIGGVECLLACCVSWLGKQRRQYTLSAWLAGTAAFGLAVLAFPFDNVNIPEVELCDGSPISTYAESVVTTNMARTAFLITTAVLCALTRISIWSHGLTYLDDHKPDNGPYYYGILISIRLSLGLSGPNWLQATSMRSDWWEAQISLSMLTFMFAVLFLFFPTKMPEWQELEGTKGEQSSFTKTLDRLIHNDQLMLQTLALCFIDTAIFNFVRYDKFLTQARFHAEIVRQDPTNTRVVTEIFRALVIIFFVAIFRFRFTDRRSDAVKVSTAARVGGITAIFTAVLLVVLTVLSCDTGEIVGLGTTYQQPSCSTGCVCNTESFGFSPVCDIDSSTTYFSACHAGCQQYESLNGFPLFQNCTCGAERAVRGACALGSCRFLFGLYQVFFAVVLAVGGASHLMQGMAVLRCVRRADKPLAMGLSLAAVALFTSVLGHLIFMFISYVTCAHSNGPNCVFHGSELWAAPLLAAGLCLISGLMSIANSRITTSSTL